MHSKTARVVRGAVLHFPLYPNPVPYILSYFLPAIMASATLLGTAEYSANSIVKDARPSVMERSEVMNLQKIFKFLVGKSGVTDNALQRVRVHCGISRNNDFPRSVRHANMLAPSRNPKARFLKNIDCAS